MKTSLLFLVCSIILFSCGTGNQKSSETNTAPPQPKVSQPEQKLDMGLVNYRKYCSSCHQLDGSGLKGLYPPLINNEVVQGDPAELVTIVIKGLSGERIVNGEKYNNLMAAMSYMSDEEIATALTYLRSNFENSAGKVTTDQVIEFRKAIQ